MKSFEMLSRVLVAAGVLLVVYAFLGKFIGRETVFGYIIPGGMKASTAMIGANTLLLLGIIAHLFKKPS